MGGWVLVCFCLLLSWLLDRYCGGLDEYFVGSLTILLFSSGVSQVSLSGMAGGLMLGYEV